MRLGLLVVLAVMVLLPSLSEGRIVSRCELRQKLDQRLILPRRLERFRETILKIVVCEANRRSHLNTGLVRVFGKRRTTTTARPTTAVTTTTPTTTQPTTTTPTTTEPTTTQPTTTQPTTTQPTTTTASTTQTTTTESTTTQTTAAQPITTTTTLEAGDLRRKREADPTSYESDESLEDLLNELEGEDDEETWDEESRDSEDEESEEEYSEEEAEEGGTRKKRGVGRWKIKKRWRGRGRPQSIGLYGLFQLSDLYYCNSGYHRSRNLCRSTCTALTDDNLMDDINCIVRTRYIWTIVIRASRQCFFAQNFFDECA